MFVHGRSVYRRLPTLIYYIFYKNIIETLVQYWFTTNAGWSGETPFVQIVINWCARARLIIGVKGVSLGVKGLMVGVKGVDGGCEGVDFEV